MFKHLCSPVPVRHLHSREGKRPGPRSSLGLGAFPHRAALGTDSGGACGWSQKLVSNRQGAAFHASGVCQVCVAPAGTDDIAVPSFSSSSTCAGPWLCSPVYFCWCYVVGASDGLGVLALEVLGKRMGLGVNYSWVPPEPCKLPTSSGRSHLSGGSTGSASPAEQVLSEHSPGPGVVRGAPRAQGRRRRFSLWASCLVSK